MFRLRALILSSPAAAWLLVGLALAMKALVPAGFMIASHERSFTVVLCSGMGEQKTVTIPFEQDDGGKLSADKQLCHGSMLDKAMDGGADAVLLGEALAFMLALGFAAVAIPLLRSPRFLSPPLRGPPATI